MIPRKKVPTIKVCPHCGQDYDTTQEQMIPIHEIAAEVCKVLNVSESDLHVKRIKPYNQSAKQLVCLIAKQHGHILKNIGAYFDNDHTTIIATIKVAEGFMQVQESVFMTALNKIIENINSKEQ